jgi:capsular polysaccharide biosynthesis protein
MINILIGIVLGICISTVGFGSIAKMLDNSVDKAKTQVEILAK